MGQLLEYDPLYGRSCHPDTDYNSRYGLSISKEMAAWPQIDLDDGGVYVAFQRRDDPNVSRCAKAGHVEFNMGNRAAFDDQHMVFVHHADVFEALPEELEDAATIDGCSSLQVLLRVVMPLSMPVMATIGLFTAVNQWNAFFDALIYLNDRSMYPLQIMLRNILIAGTTIQGEGDMSLLQTMKYAIIMMATLPILCVYPFIQKYFVQGTMIGGIKG